MKVKVTNIWPKEIMGITMPRIVEINIDDYCGCVTESDHHGRISYTDEFVWEVKVDLAMIMASRPDDFSGTFDATDCCGVSTELSDDIANAIEDLVIDIEDWSAAYAELELDPRGYPRMSATSMVDDSDPKTIALNTRTSTTTEE